MLPHSVEQGPSAAAMAQQRAMGLVKCLLLLRGGRGGWQGAHDVSLRLWPCALQQITSAACQDARAIPPDPQHAGCVSGISAPGPHARLPQRLDPLLLPLQHQHQQLRWASNKARRHVDEGYDKHHRCGRALRRRCHAAMPPSLAAASRPCARAPTPLRPRRLNEAIHSRALLVQLPDGRTAMMTRCATAPRGAASNSLARRCETLTTTGVHQAPRIVLFPLHCGEMPSCHAHARRACPALRAARRRSSVLQSSTSTWSSSSSHPPPRTLPAPPPPRPHRARRRWAPPPAAPPWPRS